MIGTLSKRILGNKLLFFSGAIITFITVIAIFAPWLAPHDPNLTRIELRLLGPSREFLLGTDHQGRCILSRLMYGARISLGSTVLVVIVTMLISIVIGTISG